MKTRKVLINMELANKTSPTPYLGINRNSYFLAPLEIKNLTINHKEVISISYTQVVLPVLGE